MSVVYFVRSEATGLVKVGYTGNIRKRLPELKSRYRSAMTLITTMRADHTELAEWRMHRLLREVRVWGEWFSLSDADVYRAKRAFRRVPHWRSA